MPDRAFDDLLQTLSSGVTVDLEPIELYGFDAEKKLRDAAPAILRLGNEWVAIVVSRGDTLTLLTADHTRRRVRVRDAWRDLTRDAAAPHKASIEALLDGCGIAPKRRRRAFDALLAERIRTKHLGTLHQLRTPPGSNFLGQLREAGVIRRVAGLFVAHGIEYTLLLASWWVLGRGALAGRVDEGWLAAWALLLGSMIPFRLWSTWWQGQIAIGAGGLLRQRLLAGALRLNAEEVRHEGAGCFLGRGARSRVDRSAGARRRRVERAGTVRDCAGGGRVHPGRRRGTAVAAAHRLAGVDRLPRLALLAGASRLDRLTPGD